MVGVAIRTGISVLTGLVEKRVDLAPEFGKTQEPRTAQTEVSLDLVGIDAFGGEQLESTAFRAAGSLLNDLIRRAREGSTAISPYCWTVARAETRIWLSGSTSSRLRYSIESGRLQKPGFESASVSPS